MILALATPDHHTHMWLFRGDNHHQPLAELEWESGRQLSDQLLGHLSDFLQTQGASFEDLSGLVIFSGPGSFTSLRIGHTVVNALADSLKIPVTGARGQDWLGDGVEQLTQAKLGIPALPHYGAESNITKPKY